MAEPFDALARLELPGLAEDGAGWQQRKSAQTRIAVLDAAIECLAEYGYAGATTQLIAQKAAISRGAMLHHYATKQELIESVVDYIFFKRMQRFSSEIAALSESERVEEQAGIDRYWASLLTPEYEAYLELMVAARTDDELRMIFEPKARRYNELWHLEVQRTFPEWANKREELQLAIDLTHAAFDGLLLNRAIWEPEARRQRLRAAVHTLVLAIREGKIAV